MKLKVEVRNSSHSIYCKFEREFKIPPSKGDRVETPKGDKYTVENIEHKKTSCVVVCSSGYTGFPID